MFLTGLLIRFPHLKTIRAHGLVRFFLGGQRVTVLLVVAIMFKLTVVCHPIFVLQAQQLEHETCDGSKPLFLWSVSVCLRISF